MRFTNKLLVSLSLAASLAISSGATTSKNETTSNISKNLTFLESYSNIALDNYTDALKDAKNLKISIDKFVSNPTQENLDSAKKLGYKQESHMEVLKFLGLQMVQLMLKMVG